MNKFGSYLLLICIMIALVTCHSKYRVTRSEHNTSTITLDLTYTGTDQYYLKPTSPIIKNLQLTIKTYSYTDFNIKIVDRINQRF